MRIPAFLNTIISYPVCKKRISSGVLLTSQCFKFRLESRKFSDFYCLGGSLMNDIKFVLQALFDIKNILCGGFLFVVFTINRNTQPACRYRESGLCVEFIC